MNTTSLRWPSGHVLPDYADGGIYGLARSLRDGMGYHDFHVGNEAIRLRTTVGYADLVHGFRDSGEALSAAEEGARLARTDAAGIGAYVPPSASAANAADGLLGEIRNALDGDGLQLAFQPVVAVAGAVVAGALLIRKYWEPISAFFSGVVEGLKAAFAPVATSDRATAVARALKRRSKFIGGFP